MKRVLITGAAGFIGSHLVDYVQGLEGYKVVAVVDALTYAGINKCIIEKHADISTFWFDISKLNWDYVLTLTHPDVIINMAAESHVDNSLDRDMHEVFLHSNVLGVYKIINAIREYKRTTKQDILFVQMSTDEVLGDMNIHANAMFDTTQALHPNNPYAATKAMAELGITSLVHSYHDFECLIVRATNNYGPNQHIEKFIPKVIHNALNDIQIPVYGTGENVREWLYVMDFVEGLMKLVSCKLSGMLAPRCKYNSLVPIFHFGSGECLSNNAVVNIVKECLPEKHIKETFVTDRKGHDRKYALNSNDTKIILGWDSKMRLAEYVKAHIDYLTSKGDTQNG